MKGFKKILIDFNKEQYDIDCKNAERKLHILDKASELVYNVLDLEEEAVDLKKFATDMVGYFKELVAKKYLKENTLGLSADKLIQLKELPITVISEYQRKYEEIVAKVSVGKTKAEIVVSKTKYETYTENHRQNSVLLAFRELMLIVSKIEELGITVYKRPLAEAIKLVKLEYNGTYSINKEYL